MRILPRCHTGVLLPRELAERGDKRWEERAGPTYAAQIPGHNQLTRFSAELYPVYFLSGSEDETSAPSSGEQDQTRLKHEAISSPAASSLLLCSGEASAGTLVALGAQPGLNTVIQMLL